MSSKRILVTGISSYWGGQLARRLESDPEVETVIGVDRDEPRVELERTEYVRVGHQHRLLRRIVDAAEIDTVVDSRLIVDSANASPRETHENNVLGTMNILAACSGADSPVRKFVFKSSAHYYGCEQDDPAFFTEEDRRPHPARTLLEKDIVEAERAVAEFASRSTPMRRWRSCGWPTRSAPASRPRTSRLFDLPVVPTILGFDPRYQFIHEEDIVGVLEHAVRNDLPGDLQRRRPTACSSSRRCSTCSASAWRRCCRRGEPTSWPARCSGASGVRLPPRCSRQLRFGRGLDNRKLKARGLRVPLHHARGGHGLAEHRRTARHHATAATPGYVYEREVEEFLRWSPSVQAGSRPAGPGAAEDHARGAVAGLLRRRSPTTRSSRSSPRSAATSSRSCGATRSPAAGARTVLVAIDRHLPASD